MKWNEEQTYVRDFPFNDVIFSFQNGNVIVHPNGMIEKQNDASRDVWENGPLRKKCDPNDRKHRADEYSKVRLFYTPD